MAAACLLSSGTGNKGGTMSQTNIAITQLAQLGFADRIAQETQGHPEIARHTAEHAAIQELKRQKDTIAKTEDSEASRTIKARKEGGGSGKDARREKQRKSSPETPEEEPGTPSPWAGNIVNLKV